MAGARIIMNSQYFRIAQPGEKADGKFILSKEQAKSFVTYVATREGVSMNFNALDLSEEMASKHATVKQIQTIEGLLKEVPQAKDTFEYQDYMKNPTIGNASEFIARAAELGQMFDEKTDRALSRFLTEHGDIRQIIFYLGNDKDAKEKDGSPTLNHGQVAAEKILLHLQRERV